MTVTIHETKTVVPRGSGLPHISWTKIAESRKDRKTKEMVYFHTAINAVMTFGKKYTEYGSSAISHYIDINDEFNSRAEALLSNLPVA